MFDRPGLKQYAKRQLSGYWPQAIVLAVIFISLSTLWDQLSPERSWWTFGAWLVYWLGQTIIGFLTVGVYWCFLDLARQAKFEFGTMLEPFSYFIKLLGVYVLTSAATFIGFCLLVVPGVVLYLGFSQCFFIMRDRPELGIIDVIGASWELMQGHKMEFLVLNLSFLGWFVFGALTWGIGYLYAYPYYYTTIAAYYNYLASSSNFVA